MLQDDNMLVPVREINGTNTHSWTNHRIQLITRESQTELSQSLAQPSALGIRSIWLPYSTASLLISEFHSTHNSVRTYSSLETHQNSAAGISTQRFLSDTSTANSGVDQLFCLCRRSRALSTTNASSATTGTATSSGNQAMTTFSQLHQHQILQFTRS